MNPNHSGDPVVLLDPTSERTAAARAAAPRPAALTDVTVGILDISKARGNVLLDRIAEQLGARGIDVRRYRKPTFTRPGADRARSADRRRMRCGRRRAGRLRVLHVVLYA